MGRAQAKIGALPGRRRKTKRRREVIALALLVRGAVLTFVLSSGA